MNRTTFLLLSLTYGMASTAQICHCPKFKDKGNYSANEIGINLYNITDPNKINSIRKPLNTNYGNGLMYKRHYNKNAIRIGVNYYYSKYHNEIDGLNYHQRNEGRYNIGELRIGVERKLAKSKLQPYFAADLLFSYGIDKGISGSRGDFTYVYYELPYKIRQQSMGLSPALGLKYIINNKFSASIESNLSLVINNHMDILNSPRENFNNHNFLFNPLQLLSLNYHY